MDTKDLVAVLTSTETNPEATVWIRGHGGSALWHLGARHERRGDRTGRLLDVSYLTSCSGRQLGGPWGYERWTASPERLTPVGDLCSRCVNLAAKVKP